MDFKKALTKSSQQIILDMANVSLDDIDLASLRVCIKVWYLFNIYLTTSKYDEILIWKIEEI